VLSRTLAGGTLVVMLMGSELVGGMEMALEGLLVEGAPRKMLDEAELDVEEGTVASHSCDSGAAPKRLLMLVLVLLRRTALALPPPAEANPVEAEGSLSPPSWDMLSSPLSSEVASVAVETVDESESCRRLETELEALRGELIE
jgi:hypothetical protein